MTSEIAVMNQRAVVLAADSAMTLIDGGTVVVRNDTRKLFNLVEGQPVALMYFGLADLMGHPWDILIRQYTTRNGGGAQARIRDYADNFCLMLDGQKEFFPPERQKDEYKRLLSSVFRYIFRLAQYNREAGESAGATATDTEILETAIGRIWSDYQFRADGSARPELDCFPPGFGDRVAEEHASTIEALIAYGFDGFGLSADTIRKLKEIAVFCVVKDLFLEDVTGLVFAGYGSQENYPVVVTYFASAIVGGILKRAEASTDAIGGDLRSKIRVFADSEVTNAFIRGMDFNLERRVYGATQIILQGLVDQIASDLPETQREEMRKRALSDLTPQSFDSFRNMIGEYQQQMFVNPVLRVLEIASPRELAETARELVALNAFRKKITAQKQTVGGPIDVAVISRESGFQWQNRQENLREHA